MEQTALTGNLQPVGAALAIEYQQNTAVAGPAPAPAHTASLSLRSPTAAPVQPELDRQSYAHVSPVTALAPVNLNLPGTISEHERSRSRDHDVKPT